MFFTYLLTNFLYTCVFPPIYVFVFYLLPCFLYCPLTSIHLLTFFTYLFLHLSLFAYFITSYYLLLTNIHTYLLGVMKTQVANLNATLSKGADKMPQDNL